MGVTAVDRTIAQRGAARFEPEFRGETPPRDGSAATDFTAFYIVRWPLPVAVEDVAAALRALPDVASADPIPLLPVAAFPNDSLFAQSWWYYDPPLRLHR